MGDPSLVRFGAFELDLRTGELRKNGIRLKLQEQPFQVLQALVERPGKLITREDLRRRVWADNTFGDVDQSLNRAVNKVREALGDSAENPRYIETMARRGYRFIARVEGAPKPLAKPAVGKSWDKIAWVAAGVLMVAGAGLWLTRDRASLSAPRLVPLTTYPGREVTPAFSPDGMHVAFTWYGEKDDNPDIYVTVVGSTTALRLTSHPAYDGFPAWSPDGRQIAFYSARDGGGIYLVSPVGGPERKLADLATNSRPAWAAEGRYLLVATLYREGQPETAGGALVLLPVESVGAPRPILVPPQGHVYKDPAFAPDGRSLAFASCSGGVQAGSVCSVLVTGLQAGLTPAGRLRQITKPSGSIGGIAWAPDGASLIFAAGLIEPTPHLWRVNVSNGKEPERLELAGSRATHPAIDLKARRLAFSRTLSNAHIWRLERGVKPASFLSSSNAFDHSPQYSPDGRRIAFESSRHVADVAIWVANADGTGAAQITNIGRPKTGMPRWSPDGRWLAFEAFEAGRGWDIWVTEASGSSSRQLTHGPADNGIPSWSRDGGWIYFVSNRSGRFEIWSIPAGGGTAVQVTRNGGFTGFESADGKTLYYTLSDSGAEGLYAKSLPDGEEKQVLKEGVAWRGFAVFPDGVYYLHQRAVNNYETRFHEFAGGRTQVVGEIEGACCYGFAVSPDRKTFLFTKSSDEGSDLMLIENFR